MDGRAARDDDGRGDPEGEKPGFDWAAEDDGEVVFLDEYDEYEQHEQYGQHGRHTDPDTGGGNGDVGWSGEERIQGGRDPRLLPPNPPRPRVLASLLAVALFLGCTGAAFTAAYHRHVTDRRIANQLDLTASASPPAIPGLTSLGLQQIWRADLAEQVVVPVLNQSPEPVVLLGAVLEEPGMSAAAALKPVGATQLKPGQTGEVGGLIKVDCTQNPASVFPFFGGPGAPNGPGPGGAAIPAPSTAALLVRAQTTGGYIAEAALDPDADGPDLQERICQREGYDITGASSITAVADPHTHSVQINLSVSSTADIAMNYHADAEFTRRYQESGPNVSDLSNPEPTLPATGTVQPGHTLRVSFSVQILSCPIQTLSTDQVYVQVLLSARGNPVDTIVDATYLATPMTTACGSG